MEDEERRRRTPLGRQIAVGRGGAGGTSLCLRGSQGCGSHLGALLVSVRQDGSGRGGTAPWGDPPAGAVGKALIASP